MTAPAQAPSATLWTQDDVAAFARLTVHQVEYMRRTGNGPAFTKLGRAVRYVPGTVQRWVIENQQTTTTKEPTP